MARPRFGAKRRFSGFCVDVSGNFRIFPGIFRICPVIFVFFVWEIFCARFPGVESFPHQKNVNKLTGKIENSQNNPEIPKTPCRKKNPQRPLHDSPRVSQGKRPRLPARVSNILQVRCTTSHGTGPRIASEIGQDPLGICTIFRGKLPKKATNASTRPPKGFVRFPPGFPKAIVHADPQELAHVLNSRRSPRRAFQTTAQECLQKSSHLQ